MARRGLRRREVPASCRASTSFARWLSTVPTSTTRRKRVVVDAFAFPQKARLRCPEDDDKEDKLNENAVKLMTVHSAKGLEFPRVYIVGMEEGILPHKRSVAVEGDAIDEERRLCYVAITRAQNHLTLTRAAARRKWGKKRLSIPSRFIREMRGEDVDPDSTSV